MRVRRQLGTGETRGLDGRGWSPRVVRRASETGRAPLDRFWGARKIRIAVLQDRARARFAWFGLVEGSRRHKRVATDDRAGQKHLLLFLFKEFPSLELFQTLKRFHPVITPTPKPARRRSRRRHLRFRLYSITHTSRRTSPIHITRPRGTVHQNTATPTLDGRPLLRNSPASRRRRSRGFVLITKRRNSLSCKRCTSLLYSGGRRIR